MRRLFPPPPSPSQNVAAGSLKERRSQQEEERETEGQKIHQTQYHFLKGNGWLNTNIEKLFCFHYCIVKLYTSSASLCTVPEVGLCSLKWKRGRGRFGFGCVEKGSPSPGCRGLTLINTVSSEGGNGAGEECFLTPPLQDTPVCVCLHFFIFFIFFAAAAPRLPENVLF